MEKLVVNLEQAKRLQAAGWTKETVFYYANHPTDSILVLKDELFDANEDIPAPTIGELIEVTGVETINFIDESDSCWWQCWSTDFHTNGGSLIESLVRLFERQNESQREVERG